MPLHVADLRKVQDQCAGVLQETLCSRVARVCAVDGALVAAIFCGHPLASQRWARTGLRYDSDGATIKT